MRREKIPRKLKIWETQVQAIDLSNLYSFLLKCVKEYDWDVTKFACNEIAIPFCTFSLPRNFSNQNSINTIIF